MFPQKSAPLRPPHSPLRRTALSSRRIHSYSGANWENNSSTGVCSNITFFFFFFTFLTESSSCQRKETSQSFSLETERLRQQNQNQSVSKCLKICEICVWQSCTGPTLRGENREIFNTENYQMANLFCVLVKQQGHRIRIHLPHIPAGIHSANNNYFFSVIFKLKKIKVFD